MGKYEPLGQFLKKQKRDRIPMTFSEIEKIIGSKLPRSKSSRAFWSNNPDNNVMTREWIDAGFHTGDVNTGVGEVVFNRKQKGQGEEKRNWHQIYGCMKGMITIPPEVDLTAPAYTDEEWAEIEKEMDEDWDQIIERIKS